VTSLGVQVDASQKDRQLPRAPSVSLAASGITRLYGLLDEPPRAATDGDSRLLVAFLVALDRRLMVESTSIYLHHSVGKGHRSAGS
jgi:hypothetical protein